MWIGQITDLIAEIEGLIADCRALYKRMKAQRNCRVSTSTGISINRLLLEDGGKGLKTSPPGPTGRARIRERSHGIIGKSIVTIRLSDEKSSCCGTKAREWGSVFLRTGILSRLHPVDN